MRGTGRGSSMGAGGAKAFLFDLNQCTGCQACMLACTIENALPFGRTWRQVVTANPAGHPDAAKFHLSLACNHCARPACLEQCPASAYRIDARTGAVLLDEEACIGCRLCSWVCPYDAPRFENASGRMQKCTFCNERLLEGREPACTAACPTGALRCTDRPAEADGERAAGRLEEGRDESGEEGRAGSGGVRQVEGFPPSRLDPSIRFHPLRPGRRAPERPLGADRGALDALFRPEDFLPPPRISLREEWPLVLFSFIAALLAGAWSALLFEPGPIPPWGLLALGGAALLLSGLHLGRPREAPRAILHCAESWLSREVLLFTAFLCVAALQVAIASASKVMGACAALLAFATLLAMDRVYAAASDPRDESAFPHSAGSLLTGAFFFGAFLFQPLLIFLFGLAKLTRCLRRKFAASKEGRAVRLLATLLRLGVGLAVPSALLLLDPMGSKTWVLLCFAAGELIDRAEFYLDLEIPSPSLESALLLRALKRGPVS